MPDDVIIEDPGEDPGNWGNLGDWSDDGIENFQLVPVAAIPCRLA